MKRPNRPELRRASQRGVVLLMSLVILVVLLGAAAALVRSFDTSLTVAGNIAFKRDLVNQAERAVPIVMTRLATDGQLGLFVNRSTNNALYNYSATVLRSNAQGIPELLLASNADFNASRFASTTNDITVPDQGVRIRYVLDRLCSDEGDERAVIDGCVISSGQPPSFRDNADKPQADEGGGAGGLSSVVQPVVYRLSLRVDGPRETQAFMQATFTR